MQCIICLGHHVLIILYRIPIYYSAKYIVIFTYIIVFHVCWCFFRLFRIFFFFFCFKAIVIDCQWLVMGAKLSC